MECDSAEELLTVAMSDSRRWIDGGFKVADRRREEVLVFASPNEIIGVFKSQSFRRGRSSTSLAFAIRHFDRVREFQPTFSMEPSSSCFAIQLRAPTASFCQSTRLVSAGPASVDS
jgi:hypothetical protein